MSRRRAGWMPRKLGTFFPAGDGAGDMCRRSADFVLGQAGQQGIPDQVAGCGARCCGRAGKDADRPARLPGSWVRGRFVAADRQVEQGGVETGGQAGWPPKRNWNVRCGSARRSSAWAGRAEGKSTESRARPRPDQPARQAVEQGAAAIRRQTPGPGRWGRRQEAFFGRCAVQPGSSMRFTLTRKIRQHDGRKRRARVKTIGQVERPACRGTGTQTASRMLSENRPKPSSSRGRITLL